MIYKFKSKASGDVLMLGPNGDVLLRLLGREPAAKGIFEPAAMASMVAQIEQAVAADEAARADAKADAPDDAERAPATGRDGVSMRQRLWPMVDLLKRSAAAGEPVVWGV